MKVEFKDNGISLNELPKGDFAVVVSGNSGYTGELVWRCPDNNTVYAIEHKNSGHYWKGVVNKIIVKPLRSGDTITI